MPESFPTAQEILDAATQIAPHAHHTPVLTCKTLDEMTGASLFFKCENFQKVGAFKFRGACFTVMSLPDEVAQRGVATHSSGNHAQALALAAKMRGIPAYIVMPKTAPKVKVAAVHGYGAEITFCEPNQQARESTLEMIVEKTGAEFVHPYNDYRVITGQATCAKELLDEVENLDIILSPVGGGGLLSGTALSAAYFSPSTKVIATEPAGADDAFRSFRDGTIYPSVKPNTIADGLLTSLGHRTFPVIRQYVSSVVTVEDETIIRAMRLIWERMKIIIEPSCAVPFAAILEKKVDAAGKRIGIILSGGNVDLDKLPWLAS